MLQEVGELTCFMDFIDCKPVTHGGPNREDGLGLGQLLCVFSSWLDVKVISLNQFLAYNHCFYGLYDQISNLLSILCYCPKECLLIM